MPSFTKTLSFTLAIGLLSFLRMGSSPDPSSDCGRVPHLVQVDSLRSLTPHLIIQRLKGATYTDTLHFFGMSRAGYIPQMLSLSLPNPAVIFELLQKAGARALAREPSFDIDLSGCPVPTYLAIQVSERDPADVILPPPPTDCSASDPVLILHTSGSSSGSPKLTPCSRRWLDAIITKSKQLTRVLSTQGQDVTAAL